MTRFVKIAVTMIALALLAPLQAHAADAAYDITVKADATKANGSPWDGVPGLAIPKLISMPRRT